MKVFGQLERAQIENLASDPTGADLVATRIWFNTSEKKLKFYDVASATVHVLFSSATLSEVYLGDAATDGTWRLRVDSGNLKIEKRVSGNYITRDEIQ